MLSSGSFTVLCFTFRSVVHFDLSFMKDIKSVSRFFFFFFTMDIQLFQHYLMKSQSLLRCIAFVLLPKIS